ncbi:hypothetical protein BSKO_05626 [Bryopsis sp. KO-2023]|nr:hypothetical protein BSKO_05626 [Bryopsis sp. KO-2023]
MEISKASTSGKESGEDQTQESMKRMGELAEGMARLKEAIEGKNERIHQLSERLILMESQVFEKDELLERNANHVAFLEDQLERSVGERVSSQPRRSQERKRGKAAARQCACGCGLVFPVLVVTCLLKIGLLGLDNKQSGIIQTLQEDVARLEKQLRKQVDDNARGSRLLASCDALVAEKYEKISAQEIDIAKKDKYIQDTNEFFSKVGNNMSRRDGNGRSLLHIEAMEGRLDLVRALLLMGANVGAVDDWERTPLHWAALRGHTEIARELLEKGSV